MFADRGEVAVADRADPAVDRAVGREGLAEFVGDEAGGGELRIDFVQPIRHDPIGGRPVVVVGIGDGKGRVEDAAGGVNRVARAPGFRAAGGRGEARRQVVQVLRDEGDRQGRGEGARQLPAKGVLHARPDHEDRLPESCLGGVGQRIVEQPLPVRAHRLQLLGAAIAAAETGGEEEQGGSHGRATVVPASGIGKDRLRRRWADPIDVASGSGSG